MSDHDEEETAQIPVDAPPPPVESERVDIVAPEADSEADAIDVIEVTPDAPAAAPPPAPEPAVGDDFVSQHPEALIAGAFAGAFAFAKLLQRIGGGS